MAAKKKKTTNADLIASIEDLTKRIDKLVNLFEDAAKHVGEVESTEAQVTNLTKKLETLLEQNKSIAKGLILLEKYVRGKTKLQGDPKALSEYGSL